MRVVEELHSRASQELFLAACRVARERVGAGGVAAWLAEPNVFLEGRTPLAALQRGDLAGVFAAAHWAGPEPLRGDLTA